MIYKTNICQNCQASFVPIDGEQWCDVCIKEVKKRHNVKVPPVPLQSLIEGRSQNNKMTKLSEFAINYEAPSTTKNISDLNSVSTDLDLIDDEFEFTDKVTGEVKKVQQKVIVVEGEQYRVPNSVIGQLKIILEDNKELKKFKVKKSGTGLDTRYMLIPLS